MITKLDKKIIRLIQKDLSLDPRPFDTIAQEIGISEERLIERIRTLKKEGIIRRFGATLRHVRAGFVANAMVVWKIPFSQVDEIGKIFSQFKEVSHCYQRPPRKDWPYNLYTMIHAKGRDQCQAIVEQMSRSVGIDNYLMLFSEREFKKSSMAYF
jgi:DNA-binding Lrp family transcriptional regulator